MTKAKMPVDIRPLHESDETAWRELWTAYLEFYGATVSQDVYAATFARLLGENEHDFSCLLAEVDGKPVGLTHFLFHRHAWKVESVCYLQDLYADPEHRGLGIGRRLIEAVYDRADQASCPSVYWMTQDFNTNARLLYDRIAKKTPFIKYQRAST